MLRTFRLCVWFGVMSRRRDVLEESGARRRGCKGWREVCVMFSDVVLVVRLCVWIVVWIVCGAFRDGQFGEPSL